MFGERKPVTTQAINIAPQADCPRVDKFAASRHTPRFCGLYSVYCRANYHLLPGRWGADCRWMLSFRKKGGALKNGRPLRVAKTHRKRGALASF